MDAPTVANTSVTIDHLIYLFTAHSNYLIAFKCNGFADYFKAEESSSIQCEALLDGFSLIDAERLREVETTSPPHAPLTPSQPPILKMFLIQRLKRPLEFLITSCN